ncbi:SCO2522 family protein [Cryptosporangium sp. NPDC051539]|uniref:SCO2522 family protein n=1 Tax=Cryptosporangium sp. NPDC051539 TaxID=3363962 RepID=UPI0037A46500
MTSVGAEYSEATARRRTQSLPFSHLSIELGHLYREDFDPEGSKLREHFALVAQWVAGAKQRYAPTGKRRPRISTCFLIDDYFAPFSAPKVVVPAIVEAAAEAGLTIDYLAREASCARANEIDLAQLVLAQLVPEPPVDTDGSRPPVLESGWLSNGRRAQEGIAQAMGGRREWTPADQTSARRHSIFVDVELWQDKGGKRVWSCPFLAAVWQLVRLGMVRHNGSPVMVPEEAARLDTAESWEDLPSIVQLNPDADPFCAYQTCSVLSNRFLPVELAVQVILSQIVVDDAVEEAITQRSAAEGFRLPPEIVRRINYVLDGNVAGDP